MNWDWEELNDMFCLAFFPMSHIDSLPRAILDIEQYHIEVALYLDMTIRGSFTHKSTMEQNKILAHILENMLLPP